MLQGRGADCSDLVSNAGNYIQIMLTYHRDMYYEKWGFMLIFWNLAGVPLSYCHCSIYLANHHPDTYAHSWPVLALFFIGYLFWYWVWDTGNSQKNMFRAQQRGYEVHRKAFPQLPWKFVENPRKIEPAAGDPLLCDGWYGLARKIHYTADVWFATNWGLITGFNSPFPWFYPVFFVLMISHRASRDIARCREKYGEAWKEYERRVPYLVIPVSHKVYPAQSTADQDSTSFKLHDCTGALDGNKSMFSPDLFTRAWRRCYRKRKIESCGCKEKVRVSLFMY